MNQKAENAESSVEPHSPKNKLKETVGAIATEISEQNPCSESHP